VILDPALLGLELTAYIQISMDRHTPDRFENFERKIAEWPEVLECSLITGQDADYLIKVTVTDMEHFRTFLLDKLTPVDGVSGVHSSFVLKQPIERTALPLGHLEG
jgi:Lrp/AsnC family leucine-responsive transcriptional regulator